MFDEITEIYKNNRYKAMHLIVYSYTSKALFVENHFLNYPSFFKWYKYFKAIDEEFATSFQGEEVDFKTNLRNSDFDYVKYQLIPIEGGAYLKKEGKSNDTREFKLPYFTILCDRRRSQRNNCGPECIIELLQLKEKASDIRKQIGIPTNVMFSYENMMLAYNHYNTGDRRLVIHTDSTESIDMVDHNIFLSKFHYMIIKEAKVVDLNSKDKKFNRGSIFWDIETRHSDTDYCEIGKLSVKPDNYDEKVNGKFIPSKTKSYYQVPTILCATYRPYKKTEWENVYFETNGKQTCIEQFVQWLKTET